MPSAPRAPRTRYTHRGRRRSVMTRHLLLSGRPGVPGRGARRRHGAPPVLLCHQLIERAHRGSGQSRVVTHSALSRTEALCFPCIRPRDAPSPNGPKARLCWAAGASYQAILRKSANRPHGAATRNARRTKGPPFSVIILLAPRHAQACTSANAGPVSAPIQACKRFLLAAQQTLACFGSCTPTKHSLQSFPGTWPPAIGKSRRAEVLATAAIGRLIFVHPRIPAVAFRWGAEQAWAPEGPPEGPLAEPGVAQLLQRVRGGGAPRSRLLLTTGHVRRDSGDRKITHAWARDIRRVQRRWRQPRSAGDATAGSASRPRHVVCPTWSRAW